MKKRDKIAFENFCRMHDATCAEHAQLVEYLAFLRMRSVLACASQIGGILI